MCAIYERMGLLGGRRLKSLTGSYRKDFAAMNEVYKTYWGAVKPCRTCVAAKQLPLGTGLCSPSRHCWVMVYNADGMGPQTSRSSALRFCKWSCLSVAMGQTELIVRCQKCRETSSCLALIRRIRARLCSQCMPMFLPATPGSRAKRGGEEFFVVEA